MSILIVDDNPDTLWALRSLLESESYTVAQASNGIEAMATLKDQPVEAIISDILMPRMDGYRLCKEVRKNERWRALPFIFYTATYTSPDDERLALDLGASKFIKKPARTAEIIAALEEVKLLAPSNHTEPKLAISAIESISEISEYSDLLVAKLEEKNVELANNADKLRSAHETLRHLLAASPVVIYALKIEGHHIVPASVSENLERMLGFTVAEALEPDWWLDHLHPEDRDRMAARSQARLLQEQSTEEYRLRCKNGRFVWLRDDQRVVPDALGRPAEIIGSWANITERKGAELRTDVQHAVTATLAEGGSLHETTKKILEIICRRLEWDVGDFWTLDRAAKVLRRVEVWHASSTEFREFAEETRNMVFLPEEWLPGHVWASGEPVWIPDLIESASFRRRAVAAKLGLHGVLVFPVKLQSEALGVLEFFSARVLPPNSDLLALFAALGTQLGQFIERKHLEGQYRQSQKMEALGQLAGGVAHDFNNLLTVIQGHTQLLLEAGDREPRKIAADLQEIFLASTRAARLTSQLLTFSRSRLIQPRPVDLDEIIAGIFKMLERIIGEDISLRVEPAPFSSAVQADSGMVEQVLMNLAVNARDAMRKGGTLTIGSGRIEISESEARLHPNGRAGVFGCLRVADTGIGMSPETMLRIFEPFFTTKAAGKGTGLGLATVHGIAQQHQGWVEVESQPGKGTTFRIYFPGTEQTVKAAAREAASSGAQKGSETILLVEDEPAIRQLARIILERRGYRILEAGSGVDALSVWEKHADQISLVITDMVMPDGMTGRELAERLIACRPSLKVIYSTGYSPEVLELNLNLEPGLNYLPKPYSPLALAQIVRRSLDA